MRTAFKTVVRSKFQVEGFHRWPNAPEDVKYLRDDHRHMFHVEVLVEVTHHDRDVEIITLKHKAKKIFELFGFYHQGYSALYFGTLSCEMLALALGTELNRQGLNVMLVNVLEDGENGGSVFFREELELEHVLGSTKE